MKQILHQIASIALVSTLIFGSGATLSVSKTLGPCLSRVQVQNATQIGQFLPFNEIKRLNGIGFNETVLNPRVCSIDGQPYYMFDILSPSGPTTYYELRATDGSPYVAG